MFVSDSEIRIFFFTPTEFYETPRGRRRPRSDVLPRSARELRLIKSFCENARSFLYSLQKITISANPNSRRLRCG